MYALYMVSWHGTLTLYSLPAYPAAGRKPLHVKTGTSLFEAQDLRYCGGTAGEVGVSILFSSYVNLPPASNARYLPIVSKLQFVNCTQAMNPDLVEMMCSTLPPEETSVSAIIAQYLIEKSQIFKELTDLRLKVSRGKDIKTFAYIPLGLEYLRGRSIFSRLVVHNPITPTKQRGECEASSK